MLRDGKIWLAKSAEGKDIFLLPQKATRHGVLAGMNNYEVTLAAQILAEGFSDLGVPVFMLDDSNRLAGMITPRKDSLELRNKSALFGLEESGFRSQGYPVAFWDIYGQTGIPLRASMKKMSSQIISNILNLNNTQSQLLQIIFRIADDEGILINDIKDLKSMINYVQARVNDYSYEYGIVDKFSLEALFRSALSLENKNLDKFFYEPALDITDLLQVKSSERGIINILDSHTFVLDSYLYSSILLWLLLEASECLPPVNTHERPKLVFILDESQLLFKNISSALLDKVVLGIRKLEQKGIGVFFCTQNMTDLPDAILQYLENKIHFAPQAYTPSAQKATRSAAMYFRKNPSFDTYKTLTSLGSGAILVSLVEENGAPSVVEKASILPPQSQGGQISYAEREKCVHRSALYFKYSQVHDFESAFEFLNRQNTEEAAYKRQREEILAAAKEEAREQAWAEKHTTQSAQEESKIQKQLADPISNSIDNESSGNMNFSANGNTTSSTGILSTEFNNYENTESISKKKKSTGGFFRKLFK